MFERCQLDVQLLLALVTDQDQSLKTAFHILMKFILLPSLDDLITTAIIKILNWDCNIHDHLGQDVRFAKSL